MTKPSKEWPEWTDMIGNVYRVGDYVVWPKSYGSGMQMGFGRVTKINRFNSKGEELFERPTGRNSVPVPSATIQIEPVEFGRSRRISSWERTKAGAVKKVTITEHRNVVKVDGGVYTKFEKIQEEYLGSVEEQIAKIHEQYAS